MLNKWLLPGEEELCCMVDQSQSWFSRFFVILCWGTGCQRGGDEVVTFWLLATWELGIGKLAN